MIKPFEPEAEGRDSELEMEAIHRFLVEKYQRQNTTPDPEMGGLSPEQVFRLAYSAWGEPDSPIQFNTGMTPGDCERSPFFRRMRTMLCAVRDAGGVKATATKNFNRKFVGEMVDGLLSDKERADITQYFKAPNEQDVFPLHVVRVVAQIAGLLRLYKGTFLVPKTKQALLTPERAGDLFRELFITFFLKFDLSYLVRFGPKAESVQASAGYTLYRLGIVADDWHSAEALPGEVLLPAVRSEVEEEIAGNEFESVGRVLEYRLIKPLIDWGLLEGRYENTESPYFKSLVSLRVTPLYRNFLRFSI